MILTNAISVGICSASGMLAVRYRQLPGHLSRPVESQVFSPKTFPPTTPSCDTTRVQSVTENARSDVKAVRFLNQPAGYDDAIQKFPQFADVAGKDSFGVVHCQAGRTPS